MANQGKDLSADWDEKWDTRLWNIYTAKKKDKVEHLIKDKASAKACTIKEVRIVD